MTTAFTGDVRAPVPVRIMKRVTTDALASADLSRKASPSSRRDLRGRGPGRLRHRSDAGPPGHARIAGQPGRARIPAGHPGGRSPGIDPGPCAT